MAETVPWQILVVDDDSTSCTQVKEILEGEDIDNSGLYPVVATQTVFAAALDYLETHRCDLLILDVRLGSHFDTPDEEAGIGVFQEIQKRRFVPIVFYTGLPHLVRSLETPLVRVVEKSSDPQKLLDEVRSIFSTRLPTVNRALVRHLESVQREYMWQFVAMHWDKLGETMDRTALAYLLARRLASSLSGPGIEQLAQDLGETDATAVGAELAHPMQFYIMPRLSDTPPQAGDLYRGAMSGQEDGYWVLLTPSCDLVPRKVIAGNEVIERVKAERVLLARCLHLHEQSEYTDWRDSLSLPKPSKGKKQALEGLMHNNRKGEYQADRYFFLPGALALPDLVVDFQQLYTIPCADLASLVPLASLDSPYAEALLARFTRYFGRLGTRDLDVEQVFARLRVQAEAQNDE